MSQAENEGNGGDEGARPSSLIAVHKTAMPDPFYELQLRRDLAISNERTRAELGPLPLGGLPVEPKRRPVIKEPSSNGPSVVTESREGEAMNIQRVAMAAAMSVAAGCAADGRVIAGGNKEKEPFTYGPEFTLRSNPNYIPPRVVDGVLIMPFHDHSFGSYCFDTLTCRVLYDNRYDRNEESPSRPMTKAMEKNLHGHSAIFDFPSVARVTWTSNDGVSHKEDVDLGKIFRSRLVRYSPDLDVSQVNLKIAYTSPDVILVVEDRTIRVYMRRMIPLLHPTDPTNKHTNVRSDLVVAYTRTF